MELASRFPTYFPFIVNQGMPLNYKFMEKVVRQIYDAHKKDNAYSFLKDKIENSFHDIYEVCGGIEPVKVIDKNHIQKIEVINKSCYKFIVDDNKEDNIFYRDVQCGNETKVNGVYVIVPVFDDVIVSVTFTDYGSKSVENIPIEKYYDAISYMCWAMCTEAYIVDALSQNEEISIKFDTSILTRNKTPVMEMKIFHFYFHESIIKNKYRRRIYKYVNNDEKKKCLVDFIFHD